MTKEGYEIFRKAMDSPGMDFLNRMKTHSFSLHIFNGNLNELKEGIAIIENPQIGIKLMSQDQREMGTQAHRDINRLFHNFLASAKTLVEHTRIFMDTYYNKTPFEQSYSAKVRAEYAEDPLCRFIQDLRNYILHKGLPHSQMSLSWTRENPNIETTVSLQKDKLLQWSKWTTKSREFLLAQDDKIKLSFLADAYGSKILHLYKWLSEKLYKHHSKDIGEFNKLQKKYQDLTEKEDIATAATNT